ncbi:hypothetical protein LOK49_LG04G03009 [Camellia lanceoleosa]|uniref:Uncharacterized protein n=1 Tax=Camellia lanceoleosa TaxID=1840588 RepID=A0ACC0I5X1_9ERIC|nr:hypothetical protein LOK49_LG04G03009 [Camellia lanceoleosa]
MVKHCFSYCPENLQFQILACCRYVFIKSIACKVSRNPVEVEDIINDEACELVNGVEISIGEGDDSILACLFTAMKNNNGTDILLLSDILGFEDLSTRDFAYRVACNGWLGEKAEELGVEIYSGFAASEILYDDEKVIGIVTNDMGIAKDGSRRDNFQCGVELKGGSC